MLTLIKTVHTAIWLIMALSVCYIGYCVVHMEFDTLFYVALLLIGSESIVVVANGWKCPLTAIARRRTDDAAPNFDIFLPRMIALYNKEIFSLILFAILVLYVVNSLRQAR
jgi:hypothetical protein